MINTTHTFATATLEDLGNDSEKGSKGCDEVEDAAKAGRVDHHEQSNKVKEDESAVAELVWVGEVRGVSHCLHHRQQVLPCNKQTTVSCTTS